MASQHHSDHWIYTTSLIASFMIGLDCFVIGFIFLYPFIGILPSILIASGGWVLNSFVYYKDGPENIKELLDTQEERSYLSWFINVIAFLGALFMFLFTIYAYLSLSATIPTLSMWITPFLIVTMSTAYFIGTFTLNKSELTKDLLLINDKNWLLNFRKAVLERLGFGNRDEMSNSRFALLFLTRIFLPILIATVVSLALTFSFYNGCAILLANCGLAYLNPILVILAISFFIAECYFNIKQNIGLVDKAFESASAQSESISYFTPGMMGVFILALTNAIANGFIAMDAATVAITSIVLIKFIFGMIQSLFTMLNSCYGFMMDEDQSIHTLNGGETKLVCHHSSIVVMSLTSLYLLSVFAPMVLKLVFVVLIIILFSKISYDPNQYITESEEKTKNNGSDSKDAKHSNQFQNQVDLLEDQEPGLQIDSSLLGQSGEPTKSLR